jgi:E3 ubiquitin-protein ligase UHRF1
MRERRMRTSKRCVAQEEPHENSPISYAFQNQELLRSLGLDRPLIEPKEDRRKKDKSNSKSKKRKHQEVTPELGDDEENQPPPAKRTEAKNESDAGPRRSARNSGKKVDYTSEQQRRDDIPVAYSSGVKTMENTGPLGREGGSKRLNNP